MDRRDQHLVLRWVIDALAGAGTEFPDLPPARLHRALLSTGLTALVAALTIEHGTALSTPTRARLDEQLTAVGQRHQRYMALAPDVLEVLEEAGIRATPVKGLVLTSVGIWTRPGTRPMADIDLLVPAEQRDAAGDALHVLGMRRIDRTSNEDVFLAWGDGSRGRLDGESVAHNGKIELHPGWREHLHGYDLDHPWLLDHAEPRRFLGATASMLPPEWLVAHVIGHLSACVIRCDVRALNVLDVALALDWLAIQDPEAAAALPGALALIDPRLVAPGLWLAGSYVPASLERVGVRAELERLPVAAATRLRTTEPHAVFRSLDQRTTWRWRDGFTRTFGERATVARQLVAPPAAHLRAGDTSASLATLHRRRVARGLRRLSLGAPSR